MASARPRCSEGQILGDPWSWRLARMLNKVPEVTLAFWVIKIMSTTVGETGADYLAFHVGLGTAITDGIMLTAGTRPGACAVDGGIRARHRRRDRRGAKAA